VDQVQLAAHSGLFQPVPATLHPGATRSFKQTQFRSANLQITFHERDREIIDGKEMIKVETDIDYHQGARNALQIIKNAVSKNLTDPRIVYQMRWNEQTAPCMPVFNPRQAESAHRPALGNLLPLLKLLANSKARAA